MDLTGLPPSVEQLDAYLNDGNPDAYERAVDRLLKSRNYGQRWAVPWLDAARYADSNGYQADQYREVWPYRDWVVDAINADMPFDQFTIEQLAGDLLPDPSIQQQIATGFHRQTPCNVEAGVDPEENRVNQIFDRVNTTGMVWLGTTLECAQCHDHKYDPFSQRDYYRLFAFFNNTPLEVKHTSATTFDFYGPKINVPLPADATNDQRKLKKKLIGSRHDLAELVDQLIDKQSAWEDEQLKQVRMSAAEEDANWHRAKVMEFDSSGGATHEIMSDQSVLLSGKRPGKDHYRVVTQFDASKITAIKLEALTHQSLPGRGPGRHHADRPNFVLNDFVAFVESEDPRPDRRREFHFKSAWANFSHKDYHVTNAVDELPDTGWAVHQQFHQPHVAIFYLNDAVPITTSDRVVFQLKQDHGGARTIGRLRISACDRDTPPLSASPDHSLPPDLVEILMIPQSGRTEDQQAELTEYYRALQPKFVALTKQVAQLTRELGESLSATTLVMSEQPSSRMTSILRRGDFRDPQQKVQTGTPGVLHSMPGNVSRNRLGLARWIVSQDNPLTARVIVNRWWSEIFGQGIVRTLEDFGTQGQRPTHPQLLDWLAVEFMENGWSRKQIHKMVVMSSTYRQSSSLTSQLRQMDPDNRLLARASRFRLPAEMIRDNGLAISGLLSDASGGPPVYPPQPEGIWRHVGRNAPKYETDTDSDRFRRGLYVVWRRSAPYPSFVNFDAPDRASCVVQRSRANTPLQALTLLNDEAYVEMSWAFARRIANREMEGEREKLVFAFRSCVARQPTEPELELLLSIYRDERTRLARTPDKAKTLVGKNEMPDGLTADQFAAWFFVANILLNLDETISKG